MNKTVILLFASNSFLVLIIIYLYQLNFESHNLNISRFVNKNIIKQIKKPNYVYIDLGLNNGDSTYNFLGKRARAQGGNIHKLIDESIIKSNKWIIYGFEANPHFNDVLVKLKNDISDEHTFYLYNGTAAWIYDGFIDFFIDTVNAKYNFWGSSLKSNHPDVIKSGNKSINMPCKDIAKIINQFDEDDFVVVKIDIEGAEYELLAHFIQQNVLNLIDYIAVEYHVSLSPFKTTEDLLNKLMLLNNVKFLRWN